MSQVRYCRSSLTFLNCACSVIHSNHFVFYALFLYCSAIVQYISTVFFSVLSVYALHCSTSNFFICHGSKTTVKSSNNEIFNCLYFLVEQCFWPQPRTEWIHQTKEKNHFQAAGENETIFWRRQQHGNGIQQLQKKTRTGTNKFRFVWQNIISVWCVCRCCWFRSQPSCHLYLISTFDNGVLVQWNATLKTFVLSSQELGKFMAHSFLVMTLNSSVVVSWVWR